MSAIEEVWVALQELGAAIRLVEETADPPEWIKALRRAVDAAQEPAEDACQYDEYVREGGS